MPMRQTVAGEQKTLLVDGSQLPLRLFAATKKSIALGSSLIWGEHCSECAMPTCYGTCAFYTPRRDLKCRRFDKGIEAVRARGAPGELGSRRELCWNLLTRLRATSGYPIMRRGQ